MKSLRRSLNSNGGSSSNSGGGGGGGDRQRSASSQVHGSMRSITGPGGGVSSPPFSAPAASGARSVSDTTHPYGSARSPLPTSMAAPPGGGSSGGPGLQLHQPPQRVIKALCAFRSDGKPQMLSYSEGDFFFVTGERPASGPDEGEGWWEALSECDQRGRRGRPSCGYAFTCQKR